MKHEWKTSLLFFAVYHAGYATYVNSSVKHCLLEINFSMLIQSPLNDPFVSHEGKVSETLDSNCM